MTLRQKDEKKKEEIRAFAEAYYFDKRESPSTSQIGAAVGAAKGTVHRYLVDMNKSGMLRYDGTSIHTTRIDKCVSQYFAAPIVGSVKCGDPEMEEESVEEYVTLPETIFGTGDFYILRASGDSMEDAGISDGDWVVIRKQSDAVVGDIVVALDENCENTLKTYGGTDEQSGMAILRYANQEKYPDQVIRVKSLVVQGVARRVIKAI